MKKAEKEIAVLKPLDNKKPIQGTQATRIAKRFAVPQLSTGDMLREAVASGSALGARVKDIMEHGDLVPDDVVIAVVADRMDHSEAANGFILDGFPRTVAQAEALDRELAARGIGLEAVLELEVDEDVLLVRIKGRAEEAGNKGQPVRRDDNPDVFKTRLKAYRVQTAPVTEYYRSQGLLHIVDGLQPIDVVTDELAAVLSTFA
jgi:adenylate kinase